jgi:hypothetical protein
MWEHTVSAVRWQAQTMHEASWMCEPQLTTLQWVTDSIKGRSKVHVRSTSSDAECHVDDIRASGFVREFRWSANSAMRMCKRYQAKGGLRCSFAD